MLEKILVNRKKIETKKTAIRRQKNSAKTKSGYAPNTKIRYNLELIPELYKINKDLITLFEKATMTAYAGMNRQSKLLFTEFKDLFVDQRLKENTSIYIYLQHMAVGAGSKKAIDMVKAEIDAINREIMQFLSHATNNDSDYDDSFLNQVDTVGELLKERINQEESIVYPNYLKTKPKYD